LEKKRILVIDDDEVVRKNASFYNLALIDVRLPDMEGTQLLTTMRDTVPKMVKIIVTGYPSLENAKDAVNMGADGYVVKPIMDTDEFLQKIKEHLKKQEEARRYDEQKMAEYIETRARQEETKETRT
jgi:YesN/AraC family two-component response regulator